VPAFQDTGQGASGRIAFWAAWTADPNPLPGPEQTNIWRSDDNMGIGVRVPLGIGGCGSWSPFLDGFSNGATSGGDNCFFLVPVVQTYSIELEDGSGAIELEDGTGTILLESD
jgi:hypothetical protein